VLEIVEREPIRSPNGPAMVKNASKDDSVDQCFVPAFRLCVGDGQARCCLVEFLVFRSKLSRAVGFALSVVNTCS